MNANPRAVLLIVVGAALLSPAWDDCRAGQPDARVCRVLADERLEEPLSTIAGEYQRRTQTEVTLRFLPEAELARLVEKEAADYDAVLSMPAEGEARSPVQSLTGATAVAWKHPRGAPVWAAVLTDSDEAEAFVRFSGGPTGHRLWAESKAGFTIASGESRAEAYQWIVENRTGHTYPLTAARMLRECGGLRDGLLIDIGCGSGDLAVELARRSNFTIKGLDIDPDVRTLFEKTVRKAGLDGRVSFVLGDAQKLPFDNDSADVIVSRGTLVFIPDIAACLREVDRVLKPTGVAFLGGRYVFTPQQHRMPIEKLREIVRDSGVAGAEVIDFRGQWVKIVGPEAPQAARQSARGPDMLALRFLADYGIAEGKCLLLCTADGDLQQGLQRGLLDASKMQLVALYPKQDVAEAAARRIDEAGQGKRIECRVGDVHALPFEEASFDAVAGVGPMLLWGDREQGIREIYRVLKPGGAALVGGRFLGMPPARKVSSETLRTSAAASGVPSVRVLDDGGQWIEIRKNTSDRPFRD